MKEALEYSEETKEFPENILWGSEFCIDFLFNHFCREADPDYKSNCLEEEWKEKIRENLGV